MFARRLRSQGRASLCSAVPCERTPWTAPIPTPSARRSRPAPGGSATRSRPTPSLRAPVRLRRRCYALHRRCYALHRRCYALQIKPPTPQPRLPTFAGLWCPSGSRRAHLAPGSFVSWGQMRPTLALAGQGVAMLCRALRAHPLDTIKSGSLRPSWPRLFGGERLPPALG